MAPESSRVRELTDGRTVGAPPTIDRLGVVASSVCAAHCAVVGLAPAVLAAIGLGALLGHEAEWGLTLLAIALAGLALRFGPRRRRARWVAAALGVGMAGLMLARLLEEAGSDGFGTAVGVISGLTLAVGHIANIRAARHEEGPA